VVGIGVSTAPAYAAGSFPSQVCITSSPGLNQCLNNWGGHLESGNPINYYTKGSGGGYKYNNWDVDRVGTVSPTPAWPFTSGTGLNNDYNGQPVLSFAYQGQYASPTDYCLDSSSYAPATQSGELLLRGCGGTAFQLFVWAKSGALIPVGPTDESGGQVVWLGCRALDCSNGQPVLASRTQSYNRPYGIEGPA
jgi:hypothetical protein